MDNIVEVVVSVITVILIIAAITVFILYGSGSYFYTMAGIAIVMGFVEAWLVSKAGNSQAAAEKPRKAGPTKEHGKAHAKKHARKSSTRR
ncbi:MAG: hypothetical protein M1125_00595 [Candidatus Marsarchaeota archaeon]|nr:hypothetical protein [Candidatus Marsarchaeota archaeon]